MEKEQKLNNRRDKITKLLASIIRFTVSPLLLMLWFYVAVSLPFGVPALTYLQSVMLMLGINLIKQL